MKTTNQSPVLFLFCLYEKNETESNKLEILKLDKDDHEIIELLSSLVEKYQESIPGQILKEYNYSKGFCVSEKILKKEYLQLFVDLDDKARDAKEKI